MKQRIGHVVLLIRDYDEAIAFYTGKLRFRVVEDTAMGEGKRWILIAPPGPQGIALLLAKASAPEQERLIGRQAGGRVFLFLHTDDFWRDYRDMRSRGVSFIEEPREEAYGTVVVFEDLASDHWLRYETSRPFYVLDTCG